MACSVCSANVEKKLQSLEGINSASDLVIESDRSVEEINRREFTLLRRRALASWLFAILICLLLALANLLYCGKQFYVSAWKQLLHHTANMDSLVALSTLIAFLFSTFITFVLTGRCLEEKAKDSTASSIRQLMVMQPKTARLVT